MNNCINVMQKNNLVVVKINENAEFSDIEKNFRVKIEQLKKIYKDEKTPMRIVGKVLKNKEIECIENIIKDELGVEVDFETPRELGLSNIKKTFAKEISISETKFHRGSLRSGQRIKYQS